jgi:hypothetical protein
MRLYLGDTPDDVENILGGAHPSPNYVIDNDDDIHELKVPSGYQSGIKLVREFEIVAGLTVDLVLDFDASASVVKAGKSGKYLLKPTIKVIDTVNNAILNGTVSEVIEEQQAGLAKASVSAQIYTANPDDAKDQVSVYTSTLTAEDDDINNAGEYLMYLHPGTYNIVAYKDGYIAKCANISVSFGDVITQNFELSTADAIVSVVVNVSGVPEGEQSATISFRQEQGCTDEDGNIVDGQVIEVDNLNVVNGDGYTINLPEGIYSVISSTDGMETSLQELTVEEGMAPLAITFQ